MSIALPTSEGYVPSATGVRLYYRRLGRGPKTVVIPAAAWWGSQADTLADEMEVVLYDPRGRGRSEPVTENTPVGIDHAVADLEVVRRHLGLERISLIGWSYLGALVVLYAAAHPEAVDRIVQVGPLMPRRDPYWERWIADYSARAARFTRYGKDNALLPDDNRSGASKEASRIRNGLLATLLPQLGDTAVADAIVDTVGTDLPNEHPDALAKLLARTMAALGNWDFRETARLVTAPVLTVHGSADNIPLAGCLEWLDVLPNARLLRLAGVGHYPFYECPEQFFAAVAEFVSGKWPEASGRLSNRMNPAAGS